MFCYHALGDCPIHGTSPLRRHEAAPPLGAGQQEEDEDHHLVDHRSQDLPGQRRHHDTATRVALKAMTSWRTVSSQPAAVLTQAAGRTGRCLGVIAAACEKDFELCMDTITGH